MLTRTRTRTRTHTHTLTYTHTHTHTHTYTYTRTLPIQVDNSAHKSMPMLNFWVLVLRIRKHAPEVGHHIRRWRNVPTCCASGGCSGPPRARACGCAAQAPRSSAEAYRCGQNCPPVLAAHECVCMCVCVCVCVCVMRMKKFGHVRSPCAICCALDEEGQWRD